MTEGTYQRERGQGNLPHPVLRTGIPVSKIVVEDGERVWVRRVGAKHILRNRDAYTVNRPLLEQLEGLHLDVIRYTAQDAGYDMGFSKFVARAELLPKFAQGRDVLALLRCCWTRRSTTGQLPLLDGVAS